VKVARGPAAWARRAVLALVLVGAAVVPGRATSQQAAHCTGMHCTTPGSVLWTHALPGSWIAQSGVSGTVTSQGAAYAAVGGGVAVVGSGTEVTGFKARTGKLLWQVGLAGIPPGSAIVSVRAFSGVVAVGVEPPAGQGGAVRDEVILAAATGRQVRIYPAAAYGGAVEADAARTVVVDSSAVVAYANATGRVLWHRAIGSVSPPWRVAGQYLYVTDADGRTLTTGVPALLRISLLTGAQQVVRPRSHAFAGTLSGVIDVKEPIGESEPILLFSGAAGLTAYGLDGRQIWPKKPKKSAMLELADTGHGVVYVADGRSLLGLDALSGTVVSTAAISVAGSLYWVADSVALGLDENALGEAWGYSLSSRRVVWTSTALPWPHFFVDLSGLGGSASPSSDIALLATCAQVGTAPSATVAPACTRPQLAAVLVRSS
jgi:outer membrane protein assembly factor BamB